MLVRQKLCRTELITGKCVVFVLCCSLEAGWYIFLFHTMKFLFSLIVYLHEFVLLVLGV